MFKFESPILVTQSSLPPLDEYVKYLERIWKSHWLTNQGQLHEELIDKAKCYLKVENVIPFVNGHIALDIAIKALDLKGNVITTPFTFASTTHALVMNGIEPRFCDISLDDFTIDAKNIEKLIDENTSAILAVHVLGYPCDDKVLQEIACRHKIKLIYDAAHVFGVEMDGKGIGTFGDVSMFSLHATKVFHSIEGGLLTFKDENLIRKFNLYKNFGITGPENVEAVGLNGKMNEFQAAMGLLNLDYLDENIKKRKLIVDTYRNELDNIEGIGFLRDKNNVKHNYSYFPIIVNEQVFGCTRDALFEKLKAYNIFARKYFYPLTCDFECFEGKYKDCVIPNARFIAANILTLPLYSDLLPAAAIKIVAAIREIKNSL